MKRSIFGMFMVSAISVFMTLLADARVPEPAVGAAELPIIQRIRERRNPAQFVAAPQEAPAVVPQPMPKGLIAHGRGHIPPSADVRAARHASAAARNGDRLGGLPKVLAPSFDCRTMGWSPAVKDQGNCGSCYQFSGAMTCSAAYYKAGYKNQIGTGFAEQYGMDCHRWGGCNGGDEYDIIAWAKSDGLPTDADYGPYTASSNSCKLKTGTKLWKIADFGFCTVDQSDRFPTYQELKNAIATYGPISVAGSANGWDNYTGGLFKDHGGQVDHAYLCIGWDDTKSPKGALLLQNQWSTEWGEGGFCWAEYGANSIGTEAMWVSATPLGPPPPSTVTVPNVIGATVIAAKTLLEAAGFVVSVPANTDPLARVVSESPIAGTQVASGSTVTLSAGVIPPTPGKVVLELTPEQVASVMKQVGGTSGGQIIVNILPGTPAGTYTIGGTPTPPDPDPPANWSNDSGKILTQLAKAMRQKGGDGERAAALLEKNPDGHPVLSRMLYRKLNRDAEGQKLLAEYAAHGATADWLTNLLDWLVKNGPALLSLVQTILALFGL